MSSLHRGILAACRSKAPISLAQKWEAISMGLKKCLLALRLLVPVSMPALGLHFHTFSRFWTVSRSTAKFGGDTCLLSWCVFWNAFGFLQLWVPMGFDLYVFVAWLFAHFWMYFLFVFGHFLASSAGLVLVRPVSFFTICTAY